MYKVNDDGYDVALEIQFIFTHGRSDMHMLILNNLRQIASGTFSIVLLLISCKYLINMNDYI